MAEQQQDKAVQTTGHAWDGDLQEFNNPLPNWWLWAFYASVLFALIYWVLYPAWPVAGTFTKGVLNTITFVDSDGNEKTTHWNTRSLLLKDLQEGSEAVRIPMRGRGDSLNVSTAAAVILYEAMRQRTMSATG